MRYFKILDENNYIVAVGAGEGGEEISLFEYNRLKSLLASAPTKLGYAYHLTNDYMWEGEFLDPDTLPDDVIRKMFADEILASIAVDHTKPEGGKEGYILKQEYNAEDHAICWVYVEDPNYVRPTGSYTNPTEWIPGMDIVAGVNDDYISDGWYIFDGLVQRCIKDGNPLTFEDAEYWEIM